MKYRWLILVLLVCIIQPARAQEKTEEEKAIPSKAKETIQGSEDREKKLSTKEAMPTSPGKEKTKSSPIRIQPKAPTDDGKPKAYGARGTPHGATKGKVKSTEGKTDVIPDRMPTKADRHIVVTDVRGRKVELSDFHLGSSGVWEYEGLRIRKAEDKPLVKKPKPAPRARTRARDVQQRLHERLAKKRVNRPEPDAKPVTLAKDTVVKWDTIKEAEFTRSKTDRTLYARVLTAENKAVEGPVNVASDYIIGSRPNGRDFVIRLRNIKSISFTANPPEMKKKPVVGVTKPHAATVRLGDRSPKRLQSKPSPGE